LQDEIFFGGESATVSSKAFFLINFGNRVAIFQKKGRSYRAAHSFSHMVQPSVGRPHAHGRLLRLRFLPFRLVLEGQEAEVADRGVFLAEHAVDHRLELGDGFVEGLVVLLELLG
jgi:hypothetical protein